MCRDEVHNGLLRNRIKEPPLVPVATAGAGVKNSSRGFWVRFTGECMLCVYVSPPRFHTLFTSHKRRVVLGGRGGGKSGKNCKSIFRFDGVCATALLRSTDALAVRVGGVRIAFASLLLLPVQWNRGTRSIERKHCPLHDLTFFLYSSLFFDFLLHPLFCVLFFLCILFYIRSFFFYHTRTIYHHLAVYIVRLQTRQIPPWRSHLLLRVFRVRTRQPFKLSRAMHTPTSCFAALLWICNERTKPPWRLTYYGRKNKWQ